MTGTRYPIAPLLEILTDRGADTERTIAELLDVSRRTVRDHTDRGYLWWITADEYACRLGFHPSEIWPDWLTADTADEQLDLGDVA